jgi:hypothetical protein
MRLFPILAFTLCCGGCLFDFERGLELGPGDVQGRALRGPTEVAPYAQVAPSGTGRMLRTDAAGEFVVRALSPGGYTIRLSDDANGDGWPERVAERAFAISVQQHSSFFETAENKATYVLLGDTELGPVVQVSGEVTRNGQAQGGAKVFVWGRRTLQGALLGDGLEQTELTVDAEAEASAGTDADGRFRFRALAAGELTFVATWLDAETGEEHFSEPFSLDAAAGSTIDVADLSLSLGVMQSPPPADPIERDVQLELSPEPEGTLTIRLERADIPAEERTAHHTWEQTTPASRQVVIRPPLGAWRVSVVDDAQRSVFTSVHLAPPGNDPILWRLHLDTVDPCDVDDDGLRDCDGDDLIGLPELETWDDPEVASTWAPCADTCGGLFGDELLEASCEVGGETYDCDDDGDGQPDVTEHFRCYGLFLGRDLDGDGLCDPEDPYPQCAANDPDHPSCAYDDDSPFVRPPPRDELSGVVNVDGGPENDGGGGDAGETDAGTDGGDDLDAGPTQSIDVLPLYPTNGADWNTHVKNNGVDRFSATGAACDGSEVGRYEDNCVHGGAAKVADLPSRTSCAGLSATDRLGLFDWICDDQGGSVRFFSDRIARGMGLKDAVDFSGGGAFMANALDVYDGTTLIAESTPGAWWSNPIVVDNDGMLAGEAVAGTIYLVNTALPSDSYIFDADRVTLLVDPATPVSSLVAFTGSGSAPFDSVASAFFWVEGTFESDAQAPWVAISDGVFPRVRRFDCFSCSYSLELNATGVGAIVEDSEAHCPNFEPEAIGAYPSPSAYSQSDAVFRDLRLLGCGLFVEGERSTVYRAQVYEARDAVSLYGQNTVVVETSAHNSSGQGFGVREWGGTVLAATAAMAAGSEGYRLENFDANSDLTVLASTAALATGSYGQWFDVVDGMLLQDALLVSNDWGLLLQQSKGIVDNLVTVSNGRDGVEVVGLAGGNALTFTGVLKVGSNLQDCYNTAGAGGGIIDQTCTDTGAAGSSSYSGETSDAIFTPGLDGADLVIGAVTDDQQHPDDDAGVVVGDLDGWLDLRGQLEHEFRTLGVDGPMGDSNTAGLCAFDCRVWDFALKASDTEARALNPLPDGNQTNVHRWDSRPNAPTQQSDCDSSYPGSVFNMTDTVCETTFLSHAYERMGDWIGNDNGLCESDEHCIWIRNVGAYQGHGVLVPAGAFTDGTLTGVTLWTYENNGY